MTSIRASAITLTCIGALWFVATRPLTTIDAAPLGNPAPLSTDVDAEITGVIHRQAIERDGDSRRNLFGYVAAPQLAPAAEAAPVAAPIEVVPLKREIQRTEEAPLPFGHRYIGRFGRADDPIAVLTANGDVLTVRRGDRIADRFTLQNIGLESIEVRDDRGRVRVVRLGD